MADITLQHITKTFGGVKALEDVSLSFSPGEIHAVIGENGAGKSTVMKILGGLYPADDGEITVNGVKQEINSVADAQKLGINIVYQELNLMPDLTVAENIFLHQLPGKCGLVDKATMNAKAQELLDKMHVAIQATTPASELTVSQQQMGEIANALSMDGDTIILDEPTAALNIQEVDTLYDIVRNLKAQGKTVIYISHRLKEIFDLSDRISVLRDGHFIKTVATKDITQDGLVALMVGRTIDQSRKADTSSVKDVVLDVSNLTKNGLFQNISFTLKKGEILGFAGLMGCGKEEIAKSLYGLIRPDNGKAILDGKTVMDIANGVNDIASPSAAIGHGIGYVTEDRKNAGIFASMSVRENLTASILKTLSSLGIISAEKEQALLDKYTKSMNMKYATPAQPISGLSGGNQQKFVLSRALATNCHVLILLEPTRGIDVGAKSEIYDLLKELAQNGMAILMVSSELAELIANCHRIAVIFQGRQTGLLQQDDFDQELIMQCATGNRTFGMGGNDHE